MDCRRLEIELNRELDQLRGTGSVYFEHAQARSDDPFRDIDRSWARHLRECHECRSKVAKYRGLGRAISQLSPVPSPSAMLGERILDAAERTRSKTGLTTRPRGSGWAIAAAAVLLVGVCWLVVRSAWERWEPTVAENTVEQSLAPRLKTSRPLPEMVAEATEASTSLVARSRAKAEWLSRVVIDSASEAVTIQVDTTSTSSNGSISNPDQLLGQISETVAAGIRPLSEPTRSAFGFLLPRMPSKVDSDSTDPTSS